MAVDPKYVETVQNEEDKEANYNDVMAKFGVKGSFEEDESGITLPTDYWSRNLKSLPDDEVFEGKPYLGNIEKIEWNDKETGKKEVAYQIKLIVVDDDEKEAYILPINIKSKEKVQKDVHHSSGLFNLVMGLMELEAPDIRKAVNKLDFVDIKQVQKQISEIENLMFKVVMIDNDGFTYKSFRIVDDY